MKSQKVRTGFSAMVEVLVVAFAFSILGLAFGAVIGTFFGQGSPFDFHRPQNPPDMLILTICMMTGWAAGGIIGALARLAAQLVEMNEQDRTKPLA